MKLLSFLLVFLLSIFSTAAYSQEHDPRKQNKVSTGGVTLMDGRLSFGPSYGFYPGKDKYFWGFSGGYTQILDDKWSVNYSLAWDQEVTPQDAGLPNKQDHTFTAAAVLFYTVNDMVSVGFGLGKGFMEDSNPQKSYEFVNGDSSAGIVLGLSFPINEHLSFDFGTAYEYNLTQEEADISFDIGFSVPF